MERDRLIELDRLLERILDGEQVDQSTLSDHERRMLKRLVEASGAQLPGLDAACGEHAAFASEIAAAMMAGDIEPGTRIGPFSVGKQIGAGGMGVVFEAQRCEGGLSAGDSFSGAVQHSGRHRSRHEYGRRPDHPGTRQPRRRRACARRRGPGLRAASR